MSGKLSKQRKKNPVFSSLPIFRVGMPNMEAPTFLTGVSMDAFSGYLVLFLASGIPKGIPTFVISSESLLAARALFH